MSNESFLAFKNQTSDIENRKTYIHGSKVQWLKIRWIRFKKEHPMQMLYKLIVDEDEEIKIVNLNKSKGGYQQKLTKTLHILYPNDRPISVAKRKDLHDFMKYNLPIHHQFYSDIKVEARKVRATEANLDLVDDESDGFSAVD